MKITEFERKQLERLRTELLEQHRNEHAPAVKATRSASRKRERDQA